MFGTVDDVRGLGQALDEGRFQGDFHYDVHDTLDAINAAIAADDFTADPVLSGTWTVFVNDTATRLHQASIDADPLPLMAGGKDVIYTHQITADPVATAVLGAFENTFRFEEGSSVTINGFTDGIDTLEMYALSDYAGYDPQNVEFVDGASTADGNNNVVTVDSDGTDTTLEIYLADGDTNADATIVLADRDFTSADINAFDFWGLAAGQDPGLPPNSIYAYQLFDPAADWFEGDDDNPTDVAVYGEPWQIDQVINAFETGFRSVCGVAADWFTACTEQ